LCEGSFHRARSEEWALYICEYGVLRSFTFLRVDLVPSVPTSGPLRQCQCGSPWLVPETTDAEGNVILQVERLLSVSGVLHAMIGPKDVRIFSLFCSNPSCRGQLPYDGVDDAIFRLDERVLFVYELLVDMYNFKRGKPLSFKSCWETLVQRYYQFGDTYTLC